MSGAVAPWLGVALGDEALFELAGRQLLSKRRIAAAGRGQRRAGAVRCASRAGAIRRLEAKARSPCSMRRRAADPAFAGGCASTWPSSFGGESRLVVNCCARARPAAPCRRLVQALRSSARHSTLTLATQLDRGPRGRQPRARASARSSWSATRPRRVVMVEASHDGYVRRFGLVHQRQLTLAADGRELRARIF